MNCRKCGAEIPPESAFCIQCGQSVDAGQPLQQAAYGQQPYGQQPYGYAQQPAPRKPLSKGMKALIFGGAGAVLLAVVLILVFTLGGGGGGPFAGNTIQTKFANEAVKFGQSISDGFPKIDPVKLMTGPFEVSGDMSMDTGYGSQSVDFSAVYDEKALGVVAENDYGVFVLLLKDSFEVDYDGYVTVYEFDTSADMDKAMPLMDRLTAMLGAEKGVDVDYKKLAEMFVNSIPEECFDKTRDSFTMTLDVDDLVDTLNNFAEKLEGDKQLNEAFADMLDQMNADETELSGLVAEAADQLDDYSSYVDFEIEYEIVYEGGKPVGLNSSVDTGYGSATVEMELDGEDIVVSTESTGGYSDFTFDLTFTRVSKGYDFEGDLESYGEHGTLSGHLYWEDDSFDLLMEAESDAGDTVSLEAEFTLSYDMPDAVEDDSRFDIDTDDAYTYDIEDMF